MIKKRFIAGAVCPQCGSQDSVMLIMSDLERIECVNCDYTDVRPTAEDLVAQQTAAEDEVGVIHFKPLPK